MNLKLKRFCASNEITLDGNESIELYFIVSILNHEGLEFFGIKTDSKMPIPTTTSTIFHNSLPNEILKNGWKRTAKPINKAVKPCLLSLSAKNAK